MAVDNTVYDAVGDIWWRPEQPLASIRTSLNPARLEYLRGVLAESGLDPVGLRVLDVGCGGGLLAEELAALGCVVSGVDPSPGSIATAERHAAAGGLTIDYRIGPGEALPYPAASFDLVTCVDVLEHVAEVGAVLSEIARVLRPGGIVVYDTINRTRLSDLVMIRLAQEFPVTRWMPRDLHAADHFIRPKEMIAALAESGLTSQGLTGMRPRANPLQLVSLMRGVHRGHLTPEEFGRRSRMVLSPGTSILYIGHAVKPLDARPDASPVGTPAKALSSAASPYRPTIREARPAEFEAIGALAVAAYQALGGEPEAYLAEIRDTAARTGGATVLVAVDERGSVLGTVTYERQAGSPIAGQTTVDQAGMRVLAVSTRAQGQGVGRALVEAVIARAMADGRRALAIYTRPSMVAAHRLYASLGFERDPTADWQFAPGEWLWGYRLRL